MSAQGRVAVVIGGAQGTGRAVCEALLSQGANVVCGDIDGDAAKAACAEMRAKYGERRVTDVTCDMASGGQVERAFQAALGVFGPVNIAVSVAGRVDEFDWQPVVALNLGGAINVTNLAMKYMSKKHGGAGGDLVLMSSMFGVMPSSLCPVYAATKHGIVGLARSWGEKSVLAGTGVRVNSLCPWLVDTALLDCLAVPGNTQPSTVANQLQQVPRMKPAAVGEALLQLLKDGQSGQALLVTRSRAVYAAFPELPDLN